MNNHSSHFAITNKKSIVSKSMSFHFQIYWELELNFVPNNTSYFYYFHVQISKIHHKIFDQFNLKLLKIVVKSSNYKNVNELFGNN